MTPTTFFPHQCMEETSFIPTLSHRLSRLTPYCKNPEERSELLQEVVLYIRGRYAEYVLRSQDCTQVLENMVNSLSRAIYTCLRNVRRGFPTQFDCQQRPLDSLLSILEQPGEKPDEEAILQETRERYFAAISKLDGVSQFLLTGVIEGTSIPCLAEELGIALKDAERRLFRARQQLLHLLNLEELS